MHNKEILPYVNVTKNPFADVERTLNYLKGSSSGRGSRYVPAWESREYRNIVTSRSGFFNDLKIADAKTEEEEILSEIVDLRQKITNWYIDNHTFDYPVPRLERGTIPWMRSGFDTFIQEKVDANSDHDTYALSYHTDANMADYGQDQHVITNMFYLNDTYLDGAIEFFYRENGVDKVLAYKPAQGDVITFPSHFPYYHAVRPPYEDHRYTIRTSHNFICDDLVENNRVLFGDYVGKEFDDIIEVVGKENYKFVDGKDLFDE